MSIIPPPNINLFEYSGRPWSDIKFIEKDGGSSIKKSPKEHNSTRLLPRKDFPLYGLFPKLENKLLYECDKCGKVLLPCVFKAHCNSPDHKKLQTNALPTAVPSKSSNRNRKSGTKPSTSYANVSASSNNNHSSNAMLMVSKPLPPTPVVSAVPIATPLPVIATANVSTLSNSSKHKKNSKSNKRSRKDDKIDILPPPPALQSPEAVHPKKIIKHDLEHVVATTISSSVNVNVSNLHVNLSTSKNQLPMIISSSIPDIILNEEIKDEPREEPVTTSTSTVPTVVNSRPGLIKLPPPLSESTTTPNNVMSINNKGLNKQHEKMLIDVKEEIITPEIINVSNNHEENQENSGSVVHMPMSPVAVVNIVPVQYLQQYLQLPTQPFVVTIPCTSSNTHMSSYPKPLTVTTRAIRKIGNTYLLQNQRLDHQRAEIQAITRTS